MIEKTNGRPKKQQSRPLILERLRSKVSRQVNMSAATADKLEKYVNWACDAEGADKAEAQILTLDQALGDFFRRDKLFIDHLESLEDKTSPGIASHPIPTRIAGAGT
jgi:hypothetical protein